MFDIIMQMCSILFAFFVFICKDVFCVSKQQNLMSLRCEVLWRCIVRLLLYEVWRIVWWSTRLYDVAFLKVAEFFLSYPVSPTEGTRKSPWLTRRDTILASFISVPCSQSILQRSPNHYPHIFSVFKAPPPLGIVFTIVTTCIRDPRFRCLPVRWLVKVKVNQSHYRSGQTQRVPRNKGSQILWQRHRLVVGCQPYAPAAFNPRKYSWYSFLFEAEWTPGP